MFNRPETSLMRLCGLLAVFSVVLLCGWQASAQTSGVVAREVGGISIDASGALEGASLDALGRLRQLRLQTLQPQSNDVQQFTALRKVSLKALDAALGDVAAGKGSVSDVMNYMAGLQSIRYVLVYPEQQDIVLVGPAEGWKVDARGNLVGTTTGWPVMLLDDLAVAMRTAEAAIRGGITCSIDPTAEGMARLQQLVRQLKRIGDPQATMNSIAQTLGPQTITVSGVPATSHFARVLVAADYRMKRIAMGLEASPVRKLPSFLAMMQAGSTGMSSMQPRWWLAADYQPLLRDGDGLAWELRGASVKAMTEEDHFAADGSRQQTGKANPVAQRWADQMTARYQELAVAEPVFGQLRNCMDLAIVAALIVKERLAEKAGVSLPNLMGGLEVAKLDAPQQVSSQASVMKKGNNWVITASGGVKIQPYQPVAQAQTGEVGNVRASSAAAGKNWWWN